MGYVVWAGMPQFAHLAAAPCWTLKYVKLTYHKCAKGPHLFILFVTDSGLWKVFLSISSILPGLEYKMVMVI